MLVTHHGILLRALEKREKEQEVDVQSPTSPGVSRITDHRGAREGSTVNEMHIFKASGDDDMGNDAWRASLKRREALREVSPKHESRLRTTPGLAKATHAPSARGMQQGASLFRIFHPRRNYGLRLRLTLPEAVSSHVVQQISIRLCQITNFGLARMFSVRSKFLCIS